MTGAGRGWGELYGTALTIGLSAFFVLAACYAFAVTILPDVLTTAAARGHSASWFAVSVLCLLTGGWCATWYFAGPRALSTARLHWLVWQRHPHRWLRRTATWTLVVGAMLAAVAAVCAGLAWSAVGSGGLPAAYGVWLLLALALVAVLGAQRYDAENAVRLVTAGLIGVGTALVSAMAWGTGAGVVVMGAAVAGAVMDRHGSLAPRRAALTPKWQLQRGASNRWVAVSAATLLDADLMRFARRRDDRGRRRRLPKSTYAIRRHAALGIVTFLRTPRATALGLSAGAVGTFATGPLLGAPAAAAVAMAVQCGSMITLGHTAEAWVASPAIRRTWGDDRGRTAVMALLPPTIACWILAAAVTVAYPASTAGAVLLFALPLGVGWRRLAAQRPDQQVTLIATPFGIVPLQAVNQTVAGIDALLAGWVLLLALG